MTKLFDLVAFAVQMTAFGGEAEIICSIRALLVLIAKGRCVLGVNAGL